MKVSIITVCFNSEKYIADAIDSVISQDNQDIEYTIIDGDSTDRTLEIAKSYACLNLHFKLAADFELMLRFLENHKARSTYIPIPVVKMRMGGATSKNLRNFIAQNIEYYKAFGVNKIGVSPFYPFYRRVPKLLQFFK